MFGGFENKRKLISKYKKKLGKIHNTLTIMDVEIVFRFSCNIKNKIKTAATNQIRF